MARGAILAALVASAFLAVVLHVGIGSSFWYSPAMVLGEILRGPSAESTTAHVVVWNLRLPRALEGLFVGAILGMVGSAFQAQFRNPLADPYIVGVSSGAAVGGVVALSLGLAAVWMVGFGFVTGMLALGLVVALARHRGLIQVQTLLLAGVAVGALLSAITSFILILAGQDANRVLAWLLGTLSTAQWPQVAFLAAACGVGAAVFVSRSRQFNAVAFGDDTASRLGINVGSFRTLILTVGTAITAIAVASVGIIGFLGLVAPHIARRLLGVDWRWSLPAAGAVGGILLVVADVIAQRGVSLVTGTPGMEVPVGIVTAVLGAPSLLALLRRQ